MKKRLIILNSIVMFIALVIVLLISSISIVNIGQKNTKEKLNNYLSSWYEIERIFSDIGIL